MFNNLVFSLSSRSNIEQADVEYGEPIAMTSPLSLIDTECPKRSFGSFEYVLEYSSNGDLIS